MITQHDCNIIQNHIRFKYGDIAEDICQEACLCAIRSYSKLRNKEAKISWIKRIAENAAKNYLKKESRKKEFPELELTSPELPDTLCRSETIAEVRQAISELKVIYREVVICFYYENMSLNQISEHLGIPLGTVKRRLFNVRNILREKLDSET